MQVQVEGQLAEARAACLSLQDSQARKKGSLVFRLIRGGPLHTGSRPGPAAGLGSAAAASCSLHACQGLQQLLPVASGALRAARQK